MSTPELVGRVATLAPMRLEEAESILPWVNDPGQRVAWWGREVGRAELLERWPPVLFDDAYPQKGRAFRIVVHGQDAGAVLHHAIFGTPRNARVELVLAPGATAEEGADAVRTLAAYLFRTLRVRRLWTEVPDVDARAGDAFVAADFQPQGRTADGGHRILSCERPKDPLDAPRRGKRGSRKPK